MQVSSLHIYPLKSARRIDLAAAEVEARGLRHDRRWMMVDDEGTLVSQRDVAHLGLVHVTEYERGLGLYCAGHGAITVERPDAGPACQVKVWGDLIDARAAAGEASAWLSAIAGRSISLVYQPDASFRPVDARFANEGDRMSFADSYPILLTCESSLRDLQGRIDESIPMTRFRPNIVVTGEEAFAEDSWRRIRVGELSLRIVSRCDRCVVVTTDQESAARGVEPLRTLATYRRIERRVYFGVNAIAEGPGVIRQGESVTVLERQGT